MKSNGYGRKFWSGHINFTTYMHVALAASIFSTVILNITELNMQT